MLLLLFLLLTLTLLITDASHHQGSMYAIHLTKCEFKYFWEIFANAALWTIKMLLLLFLLLTLTLLITKVLSMQLISPSPKEIFLGDLCICSIDVDEEVSLAVSHADGCQVDSLTSNQETPHAISKTDASNHQGSTYVSDFSKSELNYFWGTFAYATPWMIKMLWCFNHFRT